MNITRIVITPYTGGGKLLAFVNVSFDDMIQVDGIKVIGSPESYNFFWPNKQRPDGTWQNIVHPATAQARVILDGMLRERYVKFLNNHNNEVK